MTKYKRKTRKKTNKQFYKILSFILIICTVFAASVLIYFEVIPINYLIIGGIVLSLIILFLIYKLNVKTNLFTKLVCTLFSIIIIFISIIGSIYAFGTIDFFNNIFDTGYRVESYGVYVLKSSNYTKLKDLNEKNIAIKIDDESDNLNKVLDKLTKKITYNKVEYENINDTIDSVIEEKNDAFIINESLMNIYIEEHLDTPDLKLIDTIDITYKYESDFKSVNVTKNSFVLYISGVDSSGNVNKSARSDVNILAFINPNTGKVLLVNTPRDYYVTLASKNAKDKLTHAGIYGTDESANTLGLLYDTQVNYYARINFTSFIKIIDALGGIEVDVEKPDYRYNGKIDCGQNYLCEQSSTRKWDSSTVYVKAGSSTLNGEQALAYARNRHQYASGDLARGVHQQQIIEAMLEKITSSNILTKYNSILKTLSNGIITNIEQETITKLVKYQLNNNIKWEIENISAKGTSSYEVTYSLGKAKAYVINPDEESINEIKEKIKEIMEK